MLFVPQCPKCSADHGQTRLTATAFSGLDIEARREAAAHFDTAHQCGACGASYSFRSGKSFPFAPVPRQSTRPLPAGKLEQN